MACAVRVYQTPGDLAHHAAAIVADQLAGKPASVLALPTGRTPLLMYRELERRRRAGQVSFARATVFALDEYYGLAAGHPQTFRAYLEREVVGRLGLDSRRLHVPRSDAPSALAEAEAYERAIARADGLDLAILGVGRNGHIGFNEPGTPFDARAHLTALTPETRAEQPVPARQAITMGVATILSAVGVVLLATGAEKAPTVRAALLGPLTTNIPASALRRHSNCLFLLDEPAAQLFLADYRQLARKPA